MSSFESSVKSARELQRYEQASPNARVDYVYPILLYLIDVTQ